MKNLKEPYQTYGAISRTENIILGVLAGHQPVHGEGIKELSGMPAGTTYSALRSMNQKGMIISKVETDEERTARGGRGPARTLYSVHPDILRFTPGLKELVLKKFSEIKSTHN